VIRFPGFKVKKPNLTEPNRFDLNRNSVRFNLNFKKFESLGSVGFCGSNRTKPNQTMISPSAIISYFHQFKIYCPDSS
jgi:hypothetical protein